MKNQYFNGGFASKNNALRGGAKDESLSKQVCQLDGEDFANIELSANELDSLLFMIEEEKMAHDLYNTLYEQTGLQIFDRISNSETKHMDALIKTANLLGVDTQFINNEIGVFANEDISFLYDTLLEQSSASTEAALEVGYLVEQTDIEDLEIAIESNEVDLLGIVYNNLLSASENHLAAFDTYL